MIGTFIWVIIQTRELNIQCSFEMHEAVQQLATSVLWEAPPGDDKLQEGCPALGHGSALHRKLCVAATRP